MDDRKKSIIANCVGFSITALLVISVFVFYDNSQGKSLYVIGYAYDIEGESSNSYENYFLIEEVDFDLLSDEEIVLYSGTNEYKGIAFSLASTNGPVSFEFLLTDEEGNIEADESTLIENFACYYEMRLGTSYKLICSAGDRYDNAPDTVQYAKGRLNVYYIK